MNELRITLYQTDIIWEDKKENLENLSDRLEQLSGKTDLVVLPEMFSTGFSMKSREMAEAANGYTLSTLCELARRNDVALCGSLIAVDAGRYYNRGFFIHPDGKVEHYDKRHLFRMGDEPNHYSSGKERLIISYKEWKICLLICYDLRFPVWSRNVQNEYDLLIYVANWPASRAKVWNLLLPARAVENMAYVCGVNRVGTDGLGLKYSGDSVLIDARGQDVVSCTPNVEESLTAVISMDALDDFRKKFPVWMDGDKFEII